MVSSDHKGTGLERPLPRMFVIRVVDGSPFLPFCVISKKARRQLIPGEPLRRTADLCRRHWPPWEALEAAGLVPGPHRLSMDKSRVAHQRPCFEFLEEALECHFCYTHWRDS